MSELNRLKEVVAILTREYDDARQRLEAAQQALLVERFKDRPQFKTGDVILIPRKLFGKTVWWPAKIAAVTLHYNEGHYADTYQADPGGHWEHHNISYTVYLQQKDGTFGGSSHGFYHSEIQAAPAQEESANA